MTNQSINNYNMDLKLKYNSIDISHTFVYTIILYTIYGNSIMHMPLKKHNTIKL